MKQFGTLSNPEGYKRKIRDYVLGLSEEDFTGIRKAATQAWSANMRRDGRPSSTDLNDFNVALLKISPSLFKGYASSERGLLLVHLFAAVNDRYMAK